MSAVDLREITDDNGPHDAGYGIEYEGIFLISHGTGTYTLQLEGHTGTLGTIDADEFDDPLELVDELNRYVWNIARTVFAGDTDDLVEYAGRMATSREELAEENPDHYVYVPEMSEDTA